MPYNRKAFGLTISKLRVRKGLTQERISMESFPPDMQTAIRSPSEIS